MVNLKILGRLRGRLKSKPPKTMQEASWGVQHGFSLYKIRKLIFSFQDGTPPDFWNAEDGNLAAELGHLGLMKERKTTLRYSHDAMDRAAKRGLVDMLQFLWEQGQTCTTEAVDGAAKAGHLGILMWLHQHTSVTGTKAAMDWAARNGHISVLKWMHAYRREGCTVSAMNWAAEEGHLHVVKWLNNNRQEGCTTAAFDRAAMNNHVHVVTWLTNNRPEGGTTNALQWAAGRGHTQLVGMLSVPKRIDENVMLKRKESSLWCTASFSSSDLDNTATSAPSSCLSSGQECPLTVFEKRRTETGALEKRLTFGCSKFAMDKAAQGGHLSTLMLLHFQGHSCTTRAMDWASAFGQLKAVKWLSENRHEGCTTDALDHAAANGHLETVKWLHENRTEGCTRYALTEAAANGHMETVKYLHINRDDGCSRRAMDDAAGNGLLEMVHWLYCNRKEGCSRQAMENAAKKGHARVVRLLHDIGVPCTAAAIRLAEVHGHVAIADFLNRAHPGRAFSSDNATDELVKQEKEMLQEDEKREFQVQQEAHRRKQSLLNVVDSKKGRNLSRSKARRKSKSTALPSGATMIVFGRNGKPALSHIDTSLQEESYC